MSGSLGHEALPSEASSQTRSSSADAASYALPSRRASSTSVGTRSPRKALAKNARESVSVRLRHVSARAFRAAQTGESAMSEEASDSGSSAGRTDKPREDCQRCGGRESERWHYHADLRGLVCDTCHSGPQAAETILSVKLPPSGE
jgi:hypothetical protein